MDWNRVEGNWKQIKGNIKEQWGKLTDDDLDVINGRRDQLEGKIQERYGYQKDQVRKDVDDWYNRQTCILPSSRSRRPLIVVKSSSESLPLSVPKTMYGRRPRCKREIDFQRSVRVRSCIRLLNAAS